MEQPQIQFSRKEITVFVAILLFLVAIRLVFISLFAPPFDGDSLVFMNLSKNLDEYFSPPETGIDSFHIPPMQPVFLWLVRFIGGESKVVYGIGNTLLDALTAFIIFRLAILVFSNKKVAFLSAVGIALYPTFIWHTSRLYSEPLFTCLLSLTIFFMTKALMAGKTRYMLLSGITLGLASLTRPVVHLYPYMFLTLIIYIYSKDIRHLVYKCVIFLISFYMVISPITIRNYMYFKRLVPISATAGSFLLYANSMIEEKDFLGNPSYEFAGKEYVPKYLEEHPEVSVAQGYEKIYLQNEMYKTIAMDLIKKHPFRFIIMSLNRFLRLWFNIGYGYPPSLLAYILFAGQLLLFLLFVSSYILFRGYWCRSSLIMLSVIGYLTIIHMAFVAVYRYIVPVMPFVIIVSSYTILKVKDSLIPQKQ